MSSEIVNRAIQYWQSRRMKEAETLLRGLLSRQTNHADANHVLGIIYSQAGKHKLAIKHIKKVLRAAPSLTEAHNSLGEAYRAQGDLKKAVACYRKGIELNPKLWEAHYNLGLALHKSGELDQAIASFRMALGKSSADAEILRSLADVLHDAGRVDEAEEHLRKALTADPGSGSTYNNLGIILMRQGRLDEAVTNFRSALVRSPSMAGAHSNLGDALMRLGRMDEAVDSFQHAVSIQPDLDKVLHMFLEMLGHVQNPTLTGNYRDLLIRCFNRSDIDTKAGVFLSQVILKSDLDSHQDTEALSPGKIHDLDGITGGLLVAHLRSDLIAERELEQFLCRVRKWCLLNADAIRKETANREQLLPIIEALAYQSFQNEYVWNVGDEEADEVTRLEAEILGAIERDENPGEFDLYLFAAYRPLRSLTHLSSRAQDIYASAGLNLKRLLDVTFMNPAKEAEIRDEMDQLTSIDDDISESVRSQYEENPYPRWDSISIYNPLPYVQQIQLEITPHRPALEMTSQTPRVLVAGCGTGFQPISCALIYLRSDVLAVDLSRTSLAYAKRKADEMGIKNVRFAQADILKLNELKHRFDVIECGGVLHHMADPEAGLSVLVGLLKPGGFIKLGLYSALAREHISRIRHFIKENDFEASLSGIRQFREKVSASNDPDIDLIRQSPDFYSTSSIRDLLFHVQEHVFSIPQLETIMKNNRLEFLGFMLKNPTVKSMYPEQFPDDPECLDLQNWHRFEQDNPRTFAGMYQFWCRKLP